MSARVTELSHAARLRGELEQADRAALVPLHDGRVSDLFAVLGYISVRHPGLVAEAVEAMDRTASMSRHPAGRHRAAEPVDVYPEPLSLAEAGRRLADGE